MQGERRVSKATLLVYSNCAADREEEFNTWYDTVHVPDLLAEVPEIITARRMRLSGPAPGLSVRGGEPLVAQYLAMYELNTDDTRAFMKRLGEVSASLGQRGRMYDGLQVVGTATYVALGDEQRKA